MCAEAKQGAVGGAIAIAIGDRISPMRQGSIQPVDFLFSLAVIAFEPTRQNAGFYLRKGGNDGMKPRLFSPWLHTRQKRGCQ